MGNGDTWCQTWEAEQKGSWGDVSPPAQPKLSSAHTDAAKLFLIWKTLCKACVILASQHVMKG